jgi:hypothetical protein
MQLLLPIDQDPRENADVLLDTKTHARFAMREGVAEIRADVKARKRSHSSATARFRNAELAPKIRAGRRAGFFSTLIGG